MQYNMVIRFSLPAYAWCKALLAEVALYTTRLYTQAWLREATLGLRAIFKVKKFRLCNPSGTMLLPKGYAPYDFQLALCTSPYMRHCNLV